MRTSAKQNHNTSRAAPETAHNYHSQSTHSQSTVPVYVDALEWMSSDDTERPAVFLQTPNAEGFWAVPDSSDDLALLVSISRHSFPPLF